jgi:hypothetical protein
LDCSAVSIADATLTGNDPNSGIPPMSLVNFRVISEYGEDDRFALCAMTIKFVIVEERMIPGSISEIAIPRVLIHILRIHSNPESRIVN